MAQEIIRWFFNLLKKHYLKSKKEKEIWEKALISFLLEQKNNENFSPYDFEEIEKDKKSNKTLKESFCITLLIIIGLIIFVFLIKTLLHEVVINKVFMNPILVAFYVLMFYEVLSHTILVKKAIKSLVEYCNYYKINKTVVIFLVEQKLTDIQNNIFSLFEIKQYKLNRENTKPEETTENTELSTNEVNGILDSIKRVFWKKNKEENNYDYLKTINYKLDYKEYLEQQEDEKSN